MDLTGLALFIAFIVLLILLGTAAASMAARAIKSEGARRFLLTPGIAVHEFSHAFFCLLTGAKITEINLFAPEGGYVKHGEPRTALGVPLISMGPLLGGPLVLALLGWLFSRLGLIITLDLSPRPTWGYIVSLFTGIGGLFWYNLWPLNPVRVVLLLVFLYLFISISLTVSPSGQDFKNSWLVMALLVVLAIAVIYLRPLEVIGVARGTPILDLLVRALMIPIGIGMGAVIITIIILLPFYLVRR